MIEYILASYFIMLILGIKCVLYNGFKVKRTFIEWLFSPLLIPFIIIVKLLLLLKIYTGDL